jgi:hypothetical protein
MCAYACCWSSAARIASRRSAAAARGGAGDAGGGATRGWWQADIDTPIPQEAGGRHRQEAKGAGPPTLVP